MVSDGMNARVGALTATPEWFMPWRTIANEHDRPALEFELEKVVRGFFRPDLFLDTSAISCSSRRTEMR